MHIAYLFSLLSFLYAFGPFYEGCLWCYHDHAVMCVSEARLYTWPSDAGSSERMRID